MTIGARNAIKAAKIGVGFACATMFAAMIGAAAAAIVQSWFLVFVNAVLWVIAGLCLAANVRIMRQMRRLL